MERMYLVRCEYDHYGQCKRHKNLIWHLGHLYCSKHYQIMIGTRVETKIYPQTHDGHPVCHAIGCKSEQVIYGHGGYFCPKHTKALDMIRSNAHCGTKSLEKQAHEQEFAMRKIPCPRHSYMLLQS